MILKAGTYRWKSDTLTGFPTTVNTVYGRVPIYYEGELFGYTGIGTLSNYEFPRGTVNGYFFGMVEETGNDFGEPAYLEGSIGETTYNGWVYGTPSDPSLTEDIEVDDTFGVWYIANTNYNEVNAKPLAEITYNGETIAQLNAGETATLKCKDLPMASDVVVKVNKVESKIPEGYVKPEGTLEITLNNIEANPIDCSQYAKVAVNTAEPLRISDPTVLDNITDSPWGVGGNVFLYEGATTDTYESGAYYLLEDTEK